MPDLKNSSAAAIDWEPIGNTICEILTIARRYPSDFAEMASEHFLPYESVVAAAIVQLVSEEVEEQLRVHGKRKPSTASARREEPFLSHTWRNPTCLRTRILGGFSCSLQITPVVKVLDRFSPKFSNPRSVVINSLPTDEDFFVSVGSSRPTRSPLPIAVNFLAQEQPLSACCYECTAAYPVESDREMLKNSRPPN